MVPITALYAGLLGLIFVALSLRVIMARWDARVSVGDGGDKTLQRRIRQHGNFAEYAPFALLLIGLLELNDAAPGWLHFYGLLLTISRVSHVVGLNRTIRANPFRSVGMVGTFTVILMTGFTLVVQSL